MAHSEPTVSRGKTNNTAAPVIRKSPTRTPASDFRGSKKFRSGYTAVSVERTLSQNKNSSLGQYSGFVSSSRYCTDDAIGGVEHLGYPQSIVQLASSGQCSTPTEERCCALYAIVGWCYLPCLPKNNFQTLRPGRCRVGRTVAFSLCIELLFIIHL